MDKKEAVEILTRIRDEKRDHYTRGIDGAPDTYRYFDPGVGALPMSISDDLNGFIKQMPLAERKALLIETDAEGNFKSMGEKDKTLFSLKSEPLTPFAEVQFPGSPISGIRFNVYKQGEWGQTPIVAEEHIAVVGKLMEAGLITSKQAVGAMTAISGAYGKEVASKSLWVPNGRVAELTPELEKIAKVAEHVSIYDKLPEQTVAKSK